jgi:hypothetical protein
VLVASGCGGGSSSSSDSGSSTTTNSSVDVSGVIVDPYIEGAVLCEDVNKIIVAMKMSRFQQLQMQMVNLALTMP